MKKTWPILKKKKRSLNHKIKNMCTGGCDGGGGKTFTPRTPTSRPYNPAKANNSTRQTFSSSGSSGNNTRSNAFGKPRITFSGRKK